MIKVGNKTPSFSIPNPLENVEIPEWKTVYEFAKWWCDNGLPFAPPSDTVNLSDDATSFTLFRSGQFQVELYLIHPEPNLPVHGHPDVEVIKLRVDNFNINKGKAIKTTDHKISNTLYQNETHGAGKNFKEIGGLDSGFGLLAFQKWKEGLTPTTVASRWKGKTVGPKQEALILKYTPTAHVQNGYADTTGAA